MADHTEILGVENVGSPLVLIDRQILAGSRLLHHRIFPAAGMGTGSLVGVPSGEIVAQKAAAGIGNAHGSVDEGLDLQIVGNVRPDLLDLLHGKLSRGNHALCPQLMPETVGAVVRIVGLGADMDLNLGADPLCNHKNARIRDDQRVGADLF